jgi:hypothetical protein
MRSLGGMAMLASSNSGVVPCPLDQVAKASSNRNFLAPAGAS